jgi:hypothetical protein
MQLHKKFQELLTGASSPQRAELAALASKCPAEFRTWAVRWICNGGHGADALLLLKLLHQKKLLHGLLVNPGAMPLRDAIRVAKFAQQSITDFDWAIAGTIPKGTETQASRALQILQHLQLSGRVVPGLAVALRHPSGKIRSLVSKLLGRLCDNPAAIRALLEDTDARVQANAVEGLWGSDHRAALGILQRLSRDSHNRVAANAALGLAKISAPEGVEAVVRMSRHPDPRFRISAAWCIGQLADPALVPYLEKLATDPIAKVSEAARAALGRALHPEQQGGAQLTVAVSQAYRTANGSVRLRAFVGGGDETPVDLSVSSLRVFEGQTVLPGREMRPPARRDPLVTVVCLADEALTHDIQDAAREGILTAMHLKRPDDVHCVVGSSVMPMLSFSTDLGQLGDALDRPAKEDPSADWSESLLRALRLAGSRTGCRAVLAFCGGIPLAKPICVDSVVQSAVRNEIAVHVVVFDETEAANAWAEIASATRGSYRVVQQEAELQDAFWSVFLRISSAYAIAVGPAPASSAKPGGEFRLEVRSTAGYGEARFEPLLIEAGV